MKKTILILTGQYLPGFKGGGPIKSIANIIEHFGDEFNFKIITADRDLGDTESYKNISVNEWVKKCNVEIIYLSPEKQSFRYIKEIINNVDYDLMYLTGYFSPIFTLIPIILRKLKLIKPKSVLLAPRGDFSEGALKNKGLKKNLFIIFSKVIGLYNNINWHATTEYEREDIKRIYGDNIKIYVANNLPKKYIDKYDNISQKEPGRISMVFISRISPKKNLLGALKILKNIENIEISYDIYGPIEDREYWEKCLDIIRVMPKNVSIEYKGKLNPNEVAKTFSRYNMFFFPTFGENFGHVILEALMGGCPLLLSDQTPWRELYKEGVGADISLNDKKAFVDALEYYASLNKDSFIEVTNSVNRYLEKFLKENKDIILTRDMFNNIC